MLHNYSKSNLLQKITTKIIIDYLIINNFGPKSSLSLLISILRQNRNSFPYFINILHDHKRLRYRIPVVYEHRYLFINRIIFK
ncbi:hypothetical protein Hanom_Chr06g00499991 [Helianthus anomalus]